MLHLRRSVVKAGADTNCVLVHGGRRDPFEHGDMLFVAAGVEHHYEDFSADLALWRMFCGVRGAEIPDE
jgi:hypothetical protein